MTEREGDDHPSRPPEREDAGEPRDSGEDPTDADAPERAGEGTGDRDHLEDVPDGCGCVEIWEHLAERRGDAE